MSRFDRGSRRKTNNAPQDVRARRANWKSGGARPGAKAGGRHGAGDGRGGAAASIAEKSAATHLRERTGRTLEEWVKLVQETGPATRKERAEWLKTKHGLGVNFAAWIALSAEETPEARGEGTSGNGSNGHGHADDNGRPDADRDEIREDDAGEDQLGF